MSTLCFAGENDSPAPRGGSGGGRVSEAWRDWTKLPNGQPDDAASRRAPRERSRFRRSFGIKNLGFGRGCRAAVAMAGQRKASFSAAALSARLQAPRCGSAAGGESGGGRSLALVFQTS